MENLKIVFTGGLILFLFLVLPVGLISLMGKHSTRINLNLDTNFINTYCDITTKPKAERSVAKGPFTFEEASEWALEKALREAKEAKDFIDCISSVGDRFLGK